MSSEDRVVILPQGETSRLLQKGEINVVEFAKGEKDLKLIEYARQTLGTNFFGKEEVQNILGIPIADESMPRLPFDEQMINRANELDQRLVLRVSHTADGEPVTMQWLAHQYNKSAPWIANNRNQSILTDSVRYAHEPFYTDEMPRTQWSLVTNMLIPHSTFRTFYQETDVIINYLTNEVFKGRPLPRKYADAIQEYEQKRDHFDHLKSLLIDRSLSPKSKKSKKAYLARKYSALKINRLTMATPVELMYDFLLWSQNNDSCDIDSYYSWTSTVSKAGLVVNLCLDEDLYSGYELITVYRSQVDRATSTRGVFLSL